MKLSGERTYIIINADVQSRENSSWSSSELLKIVGNTLDIDRDLLKYFFKNHNFNCSPNWFAEREREVRYKIMSTSGQIICYNYNFVKSTNKLIK